MSRRMMTTRMPSIAPTTESGNELHCWKKSITVRTSTTPATMSRLMTTAYSMPTITQVIAESVPNSDLSDVACLTDVAGFSATNTTILLADRPKCSRMALSRMSTTSVESRWSEPQGSLECQTAFVGHYVSLFTLVCVMGPEYDDWARCMR